MLLLLALCCCPVLLLFCNKALSVCMCFVCKLVSLGNIADNSLKQNKWCRVIVWLCFAMFYYNISCCCSFLGLGVMRNIIFSSMFTCRYTGKEGCHVIPLSYPLTFFCQVLLLFLFCHFSIQQSIFCVKFSRIFLRRDSPLCIDTVEQLGDGRWYVKLAVIYGTGICHNAFIFKTKRKIVSIPF